MEFHGEDGGGEGLKAGVGGRIEMSDFGGGGPDVVSGECSGVMVVEVG